MTLTELPALAGGVPLHFSAIQRMPERTTQSDGSSSLHLPYREDMEFHPLKGGDQFLIVYPGDRVRFRGIADLSIFGGMDESPFITALTARPVEAFHQHGEVAFFSALTPQAIKTFSQKFPDAPVRRQGDIWSIRLPMTWDDALQNVEGTEHFPIDSRLSARRKKKQKRLRRNILQRHEKMLRGLRVVHRHFRQVLKTENHEIVGRVGLATGLVIQGEQMSGFGQVMLAEGVLTAPDHAPHELRGGPHLIARTPHIVPAELLRLRGGD